MASHYERVLAAEWLTVMAVETMDAFGHSTGGKFTLPKPQRYFATMVVYLMLAGAALFGDAPGKVAAGIGGLAALTIVLAPPTLKKPPNTTTNAPVVISALKWLTTMMTNPPKTAPHGLTPTSGLPLTGRFRATQKPSSTSVGRTVPAPH